MIFDGHRAGLGMLGWVQPNLRGRRRADILPPALLSGVWAWNPSSNSRHKPQPAQVLRLFSFRRPVFGGSDVGPQGRRFRLRELPGIPTRPSCHLVWNQVWQFQTLQLIGGHRHGTPHRNRRARAAAGHH